MMDMYGNRKWCGLWGTMLAIMLYSFLAKLFSISEQLALQVVWGSVALYGWFAGANTLSKKFKKNNDDGGA